MSFWGSLGKTLLGAAPYIAAPFTGGASLLAAPAASAAVGKLNANAAQRGQLSGYDKALGIGTNLASGFAGAYGANKVGGGDRGFSEWGIMDGPGTGGFGGNMNRGGGWQDALGGILGGRSTPNPSTPPYFPPNYSSSGSPSPGLGPTAGPNMRTPNLQAALQGGQNIGIANQPWRDNTYQFVPGQRLNIYPNRVVRNPIEEEGYY